MITGTTPNHHSNKHDGKESLTGLLIQLRSNIVCWLLYRVVIISNYIWQPRGRLLPLLLVWGKPLFNLQTLALLSTELLTSINHKPLELLTYLQRWELGLSITYQLTYPKDPQIVPYQKSESFNAILWISQDLDKTHFQENNAIWH